MTEIKVDPYPVVASIPGALYADWECPECSKTNTLCYFDSEEILSDGVCVDCGHWVHLVADDD